MEWEKNITCLTKEEIEKFLSDNKVEIVFKSEEEGIGQTMTGKTKYWHIYRYIIKKK